MTGDTRLIRSRMTADRSALARLDRPLASGGSFFVGMVIDGGHMATLPDHYYLLNPVDPGGAECEGCDPDFDVDTDQKIPVLVINATPRVGDKLIARSIGGRWLAELTGGGKGPDYPIYIGHIPQCFCDPAPEFLKLTVVGTCFDGALGNHRSGLFRSATLVLGPAPPPFDTFGVGDKLWWSNEVFTDGPGDFFPGATWRYVVRCIFNLISIFIAYTGNTGTPQQDTGIGQQPIATWTFADSLGPGGQTSPPTNTCHPFLMPNSILFPGAPPDCSLTLEQA